ncbi:MAG TPA: hypothetical protein VMG30_11545 [Acidobacteriota bacterium]|nr:hypothetical protein [Acidobacteriota bacterium]
MMTRFDDEPPRERIAEMSSGQGEELVKSGELQDGITVFRDSLRTAAERPEAFWTSQRAAITENLRRAAPTLRMKSALIWVPVSVAALVCFFLFMEKPGVPAPDFAVGADQNLLIDVEQALYRDCPEALAPAAALVQEIK